MTFVYEFTSKLNKKKKKREKKRWIYVHGGSCSCRIGSNRDRSSWSKLVLLCYGWIIDMKTAATPNYMELQITGLQHYNLIVQVMHYFPSY